MLRTIVQFHSKRLLFLLVTIFIVHLSFRIYGFLDEYKIPHDPKYWEDRYLRSQWVQNPPIEAIGDDGLYTYVAWENIHGKDPTLVNPETPPVGKYLLGFTLLIFHNQHIFGLLTGIFALVAFFLFNKMLFKNTLYAFIPVFLFSLEPLFFTQLRAPFFDLLQLGFLLSTFLFFLKKRYILSGVFFGLTIATKGTHTIFLVLAATLLIFLFTKERKEIVRASLLIFIGITAAFLISYVQFFLLGNSFIDFLKVQKFIFAFYATGAKAVLGSGIAMFVTGRWQTWWGEILHVDEWQITWPILLLGFGASSFRAIQKEVSDEVFLVLIWSALYLGLLFVAPSYPRYLLLLIPFLYNLLVWFFLSFKGTK